MQQFPSTEAKDKWGLITDAALQSPVTITKHGRPSLVVTSVRDYEELQSLKYNSLKADIAAGVEQLDRGEGIELANEGEIRSFMDDISKRGTNRLNQKGK